MKRSFLGIRILAALTVTVTVCFVAVQAFALDPQKTMTQFKHRSWGGADGIDRVRAIAQTQDGYIWIGAGSGLFRFDGVTFVRWTPKSGDPDVAPWKMLGGKDGSLWVACGENGVLQLKHESSRFWKTTKDGSTITNVKGIYEAKDGTMWFAGSRLARFADGQIEIIGTESGLPNTEFSAVIEDPVGTLWVVMYDKAQTNNNYGSVAFRLKGESRFRLSPQRLKAVNRLQLQNGKIWIAETRRSVRAFINNGADIQFQLPEIQVGSQDILFDRDGALWVTTLGDGLRRIKDTDALGTNNIGQSSERADKFLRTDGLSGDVVFCIFEDREGNIWVGTAAGLDCFRENKITSFSAREGLPFDQNTVVACTADGTIWAGSTPRGFMHSTGDRGVFVNRKWPDLTVRVGTTAAVPEVYCMLKSQDSRLLAGTGAGVILLSTNGTAQFFRLPGDLQLHRVRAMTFDTKGGLWLSDSDKGTYHILNGKADRVTQISEWALVAQCDDAGRVWFGHASGGLGLYESGQYKYYPSAKNNLPHSIHAILSEPGGKVWFVGDGGISFFNGETFQMLTRKNGLPGDDLAAVLKDDHGFYWFAGMDAIFSITPQNLEKAFSSEAGIVCDQVLNSADGLRGFIRPNLESAHPLATKGPDGNLWFSAGNGLAVVNPRLISKNSSPPPVHIEKLVANRKTYQELDSLDLPIGTRSCLIDYVGLSFSNPAKVRYRYKLENYDENWVDAGASRQASYSNLRPRKYKFQVLACNDDGVWNEAGDSIEFAILPAFYERPWFPILCALPGAMAVWGLHRFRLARVTARVKRELEGQIRGQIKERKRIAQELHDTLLQGFTGIGLKLHAITKKLPESLSDTKEQLQKILTQSDRYLTEARRSVWELRSTSLEKTDDFAKVLSEAAERIVEGTVIRLNFSVNGEQQKLSNVVEDNLLRICQEAVTNAVKHARPTAVSVSLEFDAQKVVLRIKDNGCGFDLQGPEATKSGHFGLMGLQERVRAMGGSLSLKSEPRKGTEITVSVNTV